MTTYTWNLSRSRTFKALKASNLETLVYSNEYGMASKEIIDEIPKYCVNLKKLTLISPQMFMEYSFKSICEKYPALVEFHYLYGGHEGYKSPIYCDILRSRVKSNFRTFEKSSGKLKHAHICYNARAAIICRCPKNLLTLGCLWSFRDYVNNLCQESDQSPELSEYSLSF